MSWYVIQTYTGREEQLVEMIRRIVPQNYYGECFVAYSEQLRHRQQENQIHVLRLFPGYVFISSDKIQQLFCYLKKVPAMSKIMTADDFVFTPLCDGEAEFLLGIMDAGHIVRLSYVATDGKDRVTYLSGPLEQCRAQILSYRFRKRYAVVRLMLDGREKEVKLGIILNDDIRRELAYGRMEALIDRPGSYTVPWQTGRSEEKTGEQKNPGVAPGDRVLVMEGAFEGSTATVSQTKKDTLKITVQMFGREIPVEVSAGCVNKIK